jgi:hypothetical protein
MFKVMWLISEKAVIRWERSFGGSGHSVGAVIRWERSFGGSGHSVGAVIRWERSFGGDLRYRLRVRLAHATTIANCDGVGKNSIDS